MWHKSLLSNYPPTDSNHPSALFFSISSFLSGRSISTVVDGYCSKFNSINSGVPQGSPLSPTLFLLLINDLSIAKCLTHSFADDFTLHYSITFKSHPSQIALNNARLDATEPLTSELLSFAIGAEGT